MPTSTEAKVTEVVETCRRHGSTSIIGLVGVPGTGKSHIALEAARKLASQPEMISEIQFSPAWSYEEFIEGLRINAEGKVEVHAGAFMRINQLALDDQNHYYVLLIEEFTRANLPTVLGELLTYIEYRNRTFNAQYSRRPVSVAPNLTILTTFNPNDRSALELDDALMRRMRLVHFPPDNNQLREMLSGCDTTLVDGIAKIFDECRNQRPNDWSNLIPFGHGIFAGVRTVDDLKQLWHQRIRPILHRPLVQPHPFADCIDTNYPWK